MSQLLISFFDRIDEWRKAIPPDAYAELERGEVNTMSRAPDSNNDGRLENQSHAHPAITTKPISHHNTTLNNHSHSTWSEASHPGSLPRTHDQFASFRHDTFEGLQPHPYDSDATSPLLSPRLTQYSGTLARSPSPLGFMPTYPRRSHSLKPDDNGAMPTTLPEDDAFDSMSRVIEGKSRQHEAMPSLESHPTRRVFSADDALNSFSPLAPNHTTYLHPHSVQTPPDPRRTVSADDIRRDSPYPAVTPRLTEPFLPLVPFQPVEEDRWAKDIAEAAMREFDARQQQQGRDANSSLENTTNANTMGKDSGVDVGTLYAARGRGGGSQGDVEASRRPSKKKQPVVIYVSEKESPEPGDKGSRKEGGEGGKKWARYRMFRKYSGKKRSFFASVAASRAITARKGKGKGPGEEGLGRDVTVAGGASRGGVNGGFLGVRDGPLEVQTLQRDVRGQHSLSFGRNRSLSAAPAMEGRTGSDDDTHLSTFPLTPHAPSIMVGPSMMDKHHGDGSGGNPAFPTLLINGVEEDIVKVAETPAVCDPQTVDPLYRTVTWNQRGALRVCNASTLDSRGSVGTVDVQLVKGLDVPEGKTVVVKMEPFVSQAEMAEDKDMWVDEESPSKDVVVPRRASLAPSRRMSRRQSTKMIRVRSGSVAQRAGTVGVGRSNTKSQRGSPPVGGEMIEEVASEDAGTEGDPKEWVDQPAELGITSLESDTSRAMYPSPPLTPGGQVNQPQPSAASSVSSFHSSNIHLVASAPNQLRYPYTPLSPPPDNIPPPIPMLVTATPDSHHHPLHHRSHLPHPHSHPHPYHNPYPHHQLPTSHHRHPIHTPSYPSPSPHSLSFPTPPHHLPATHNLDRAHDPTRSFKVINVRHVASGSGEVLPSTGYEDLYAAAACGGNPSAVRRNSSKRSKRKGGRRFKVLKVFFGKFKGGGSGNGTGAGGNAGLGRRPV